MQRIYVCETELQLLPERAIYIQSLDLLLVSDVHLGKSETFQQAGIPISSQVNQRNLERLQKLWQQFQPKQIWILGDLFHARQGISDELLHTWQTFTDDMSTTLHLILGNHDRPIIPLLEPFNITCYTQAVELNSLILSHEPVPDREDSWERLNLCGHIHPCLKLQSRLDSLRLPCFFLDRAQSLMVLPSFGEFTGGYEVTPTEDTVAYAIADNAIIPFEGIPAWQQKPTRYRRDR